ncbi:MAG: DNA gyrase inhibitor YacG [Myxococcales bacterium]|nr:DNA gyrase inhibitor YacG [Myxococcales bacterium]
MSEKSTCPICKAEAERRPANKAYPFCSKRCRTIDLGKWLNGDYRVPVEEPDEADVAEIERGLARHEPS